MQVLDGPSRLLPSTLVIHTEMEFTPIYDGRPLYSGVGRALRHLRLMFDHFYGLEGRRVLAGGDAVVGRRSRFSGAMPSSC